MSLVKTLVLPACCFLVLALIGAPVRAHAAPLLQEAQSDTSDRDTQFESFLNQLITRIQSDIESSITMQESHAKRNDMRDDMCTDEDPDNLSDSVTVKTGDQFVARDEVISGDLYIRDGTLTVEGLIRGNVTVLHGDIIVRSGGRITGNARVINGTIQRDENGIVEGEIRETTTARTDFFTRFLTGRSTSHSFAPRWLHENLYTEGPVFRYNRVEGVYLGLSSDKKFYWNGNRLISGYGSFGYGFLTHRWRGQLGLDRQFAGSAGLFEFGGEGHNLTDTKDDWIISQTENTLAAFFFREDYRDYFQRSGFSGHTAWYLKSPDLSSMVNVEYKYDDYKSLERNTNWSLFKNKDGFRENPAVNDGIMRSINVTAGLSTVGRERPTLAGWNASAQAEFAGHSLGGDFSFTRGVIDVRRYQPISRYDNVNVRLRLGSLEGDAVVQKIFELGGVNTLPAFGFKQFAGNRMVLGNIEYALNGSVFDDVSFWPGFLTVMLFADAGDARVVDTQTTLTSGFQDFSLGKLKSDIGFALGWHDESVRLGFAWRTDKSAPPMVFIRLSRPF